MAPRRSRSNDAQASNRALHTVCWLAVPAASHSHIPLAQDHFLVLATGPVGDLLQQLFWMRCLLQRLRRPGETQMDVAQQMAAAGQQQFGRPLSLRFPTGMGAALSSTQRRRSSSTSGWEAGGCRCWTAAQLRHSRGGGGRLRRWMRRARRRWQRW